MSNVWHQMRVFFTTKNSIYRQMSGIKCVYFFNTKNSIFRQMSGMKLVTRVLTPLLMESKIASPTLP